MSVPFGVSELLNDPDFCQSFTITRTSRTVGDYGRVTTSEGKIDATGVIVPPSAKQLDRLPEGDRSHAEIAVYTTTPLTLGESEHSADTIAWHDKTYRVISVQDFSDYGGGLYVAICARVDVQGQTVADAEASDDE